MTGVVASLKKNKIEYMENEEDLKELV